MELVQQSNLFILKEIRLPSSVGAEINRVVLVGGGVPSKIKPPADGRGALEYDAYLVQARQGVLEYVCKA